MHIFSKPSQSKTIHSSIILIHEKTIVIPIKTHPFLKDLEEKGQLKGLKGKSN